ncbi:MAG: guanylate kinase [Patescibacteria group bacterium]
MEQKRILVIAGPTGVGESTITKKIIKDYPIFKKLISATTRKPRLKEKHGIDYYFFSNKKFKEEIKKGNIFEYQNTMDKNIYYGSYKPELDKKISTGSNVIVNPDIVGTKFYKENFKATTIFIAPKSIDELKKRLITRNSSISARELKKRLDYAKNEIKKEAHFYDYIVINEQNKLETAVNKVVSIINNEGYKLKK